MHRFLSNCISLLSITALLTLLLTGAAQETASPTPDDLIGQWQVDLRPTPDAAPYYTELRINSITENKVLGMYYGSPLENGKINTHWGRVVMAFTTQDGSGVYNTTIELKDGRLYGTTHAVGRGFLAVWTAERK